MKSFYKNQNLNLIASMAQQIVFNNSKNGKLESTNTQDAIDEISNILDEEKTMISDAWNIETTYTVGQYCIYNDCLWKCKVQHTGQAPTEGTYWTKTQIDDEILAIKNDVSTINSNLDLCNDFGSLHFINSFNHSTDTLVSWEYIKCRYFLLSIESDIEGTRINSIMIPTSQNGSDILYSSYKQHIISGKNISGADCMAIFKPQSENSAIIRTVNCSLKLYAII